MIGLFRIYERDEARFYHKMWVVVGSFFCPCCMRLKVKKRKKAWTPSCRVDSLCEKGGFG